MKIPLVPLYCHHITEALVITALEHQNSHPACLHTCTHSQPHAALPLQNSLLANAALLSLCFQGTTTQKELLPQTA